MKKTVLLFLAAFFILLACKNNNEKNTDNNPKPSMDSVEKRGIIDVSVVNDDSFEPEKKEPLSGDYCFLKVEKKDSTIVKLRVLSEDDIRGEMVWHPWEKDGAAGSLTGKMNDKGEMELLYDYMIEGMRQTETKIMKIENGKLMIKIGELKDPKNNGHLTYKDAGKAKYTETLNPVNCF